MKVRIIISARLRNPDEDWSWEFPQPVTYATPQQLQNFLVSRHGLIRAEGGIRYQPNDYEICFIGSERIVQARVLAIPVTETVEEQDQRDVALVFRHHPEMAKEVH